MFVRIKLDTFPKVINNIFVSNTTEKRTKITKHVWIYLLVYNNKHT